MEFTAKQIAEYISGRVEGDGNAAVTAFAKIEEAHKGDLTFLSNPKYSHYLYGTEASIVLVDSKIEVEKPVEATLIRVDNAYECVAKLLQLRHVTIVQHFDIVHHICPVETVQRGTKGLIRYHNTLPKGKITDFFWNINLENCLNFIFPTPKYGLVCKEDFVLNQKLPLTVATCHAVENIIEELSDGYIKEKDVKRLFTSSTTTALQEVLAGNADLAVTNETSFEAYKDKGIKFIFRKFNTKILWCLFKRKEH